MSGAHVRCMNVHVRCVRMHVHVRCVRVRCVHVRCVRGRARVAWTRRSDTMEQSVRALEHELIPPRSSSIPPRSSILATSRRRGARLARSATRDDRCALTAQSRPVRGLDQAPRRLGDFSGPNSQDRLEGSCGFALNTLGTTRRRPWILTAQRWPERRCVSVRTGTKKLKTTRDHQSR